MSAKAQTYEFQAETKRLLDLVVHSLYTNKDVFLRELISNASDALDRLRFESLTQPDLVGEDEKFQIRLEADPKTRVLRLHDNGIGMSRDEVIQNLGTIARSGTREIKERLAAETTSEGLSDLIGQFGVGFYSAFMVADRVVVTTRRAGEATASIWESAGDGQYSISESTKDHHGTTIELHLKPIDTENGIHDYTDAWVLQKIVQQHSDFVSYPIVTETTREERERDADGNPIEGTSKTIVEDKTLNSMKPIWTRAQNEVTAEEYADFYKHISHDWSDPLETLPLKAEGRVEYRALVFIPSKAPFDLFFEMFEGGLRLYAKGVMIMERCDQLLPKYLRFVRGIVDSADLPLNISRQMLQQDWQITAMRKWISKKILDSLAAMQKDSPEKYATFYREFGAVLKEGVVSDGDNKDRIVNLLQFESSAADDKHTTLAEYVERMKDGQSDIYYITAESRAVAESSPQSEALRERDLEVLYFLDPVDEYMVQSVREFDGKKLKAINKGDLEIGDEEERKSAAEELKKQQEEFASFLSAIQQKLSDQVREVRLSNRLRTSPACIVGADYDVSPYLEKLLKRAGTPATPHQRVLELNPGHDLVVKLRERYDADNNDEEIAKYARLLFGSALLADGAELPDPGEYNRLVTELMLKSL